MARRYLRNLSMLIALNGSAFSFLKWLNTRHAPCVFLIKSPFPYLPTTLLLQSYSPHRSRFTVLILGLILGAVSVFSLTFGALSSDLGETLRSLGHFWGLLNDPNLGALPQVIGQIRLPRLLMGMIAGAGLAVTGAVLQALFRNPMADPGLLGVSSGAALGAAAAIVLGLTFAPLFALFGNWLLLMMAFFGSFLSLSIVYRLARFNGRTDIATMLLAGVAVNAITGALIGLLSYLASDTQLRDIVFWSLGSLSVNDWSKLLIALIIVLPGCTLLLFYAKALNAHLLGESEARHLGFDVETIKKRLILLCALIVSVIVSMSGIIGFVGLIVPHLIRLIFGPDHRLLLPASALSGAILLVLGDVIARTLISPAEIPIGIITAVLGGPFFMALLIRYKRRQGF